MKKSSEDFRDEDFHCTIAADHLREAASHLSSPAVTSTGGKVVVWLLRCFADYLIRRSTKAVAAAEEAASEEFNAHWNSAFNGKY